MRFIVGLDMRPMGKPKLGFEKRFIQIFKILEGEEIQNVELFDESNNQKEKTKDELLEEWFDIQIPSYETIKAPRVGKDEEANEWIKSKYPLSTDKTISEADFIKLHEGYYIIELAKELDGVPMYIAANQDENVFRGEFLKDCIDLIGEDLVNEAWNTKLANEAWDYGQRLMKVADKIAIEYNLQYLKDQRIPPDVDEDSIESKLHIVFSLAKWLIFYGKNGHGYEADF